MRVRQFNPELDYEDVKTWWECHGWAPQVLTTLSRTGFMAEDNGLKYCACWLYQSDSALGFLEFFVSNPKSPLKGRGIAVKRLLRAACEVADAQGLILVTSLKSRGLIREYERVGFKRSDEGMTNMVRVK